jgi:hypothetical protein
MIKKIASGGQTGADRAALDVAIEYGIPHGGWVPRGRKAEDGRLSEKYHLKEIQSISYPRRTELNVIDSDGTLIISHGNLSGGSAYTLEMAKKHKRPCIHIDLNQISEYKAVEIIKYWTEVKGIEILNVAGARISEDPQIYEATKNLLKSVLYPPPEHIVPQVPKTIQEAVETLISSLSLKDKADIANMKKDELFRLEPILENTIRDHFGLRSGNDRLMQSCRSVSGDHDLQENDASSVIISELWKRLRETHLLRVLK